MAKEPKTFKVDFAKIKSQFSISDALAHYGVALTGTGDQRRGKCPIHEGDNATSLSVNITTNAFHCFSCGEKGNHLELICKLEDCSLKVAALNAIEWFGIDAAKNNRTPTPTSVRRKKQPDETSDEAQEEGGETATGNKALEFTLKLEPDHPYLAGRGLDAETIERFGLGFCARGTMKNRIAIPIRNPDEETVAYAGRWIGEGEPPEGEGKYKFPKGFSKSLELFADWTSVRADCDNRVLIIVEGFFSCLLLEQWGARVVSTMGASMSDAQFELIRAHAHPGDRFVILYDGDDAGREGASKAAPMLATIGFIRIIELPEGKQPDGYNREDLLEMVPELLGFD